MASVPAAAAPDVRQRLLIVALAFGAACAAHAQDFPITDPPPEPVANPPAQARAADRAVIESDLARLDAERLQRKRAEDEALALDAQQLADALAAGPPEIADFVGPPALADLPADPDKPAAKVALGAIELLGESIEPGTRKELRWQVGTSFDGDAVTTPITIIHGSSAGPKLCLTAAVHGDELNGVEVVRRVANEIDPKELSGTLIAIPIVNLLGFSRGTRYLPDRRDLNRFFPGSPNGSAASRIAYSLFKSLIQHCDALVDFHTGSFDRANLPQVRGDLTLDSVLEFTRGFGATPVLHSPGSRGMLRLAATDHGIPAVTFEVGAPARLEPDQIDFAVQAISALMHAQGMTKSFRMWAEPQATFYESRWVRANHGGMLFSTVKLGDRVRQGQRLGKVVDPIKNAENEIMSPFRGRVIGIALNQLVLPGFAAYHIGIERSEEQAVEEASQPAATEDELERLEGDEMNERRGEPTGEPVAEPPGIR
ncbi:MAG TPA: succinylglutamate desuccinylase/aspartoacylase family protein [Candidatus Saccharimonadia bacterium]|nr:succinylglutamate desuccinylase/aspartoacylase family protein [Candidatus Saccharimonadia bacterium]